MKSSDQAKILAASIYQALSGVDKKNAKALVANFQEYLKEHHLQASIPKVLAELERFYLADNDMVAAQILSRYKLADTDTRKIIKMIKDKTGKKAIVKEGVDENLLGGAVIKYEDKIIDMSLKNQLTKLSKQLKAN